MHHEPQLHEFIVKPAQNKRLFVAGFILIVNLASGIFVYKGFKDANAELTRISLVTNRYLTEAEAKIQDNARRIDVIESNVSDAILKQDQRIEKINNDVIDANFAISKHVCPPLTPPQKKSKGTKRRPSK